MYRTSTDTSIFSIQQEAAMQAELEGGLGGICAFQHSCLT